MLRETLELSKGGRALLQGRGPELRSAETEGQMLQRVMPELMGMKNVMVFNDEAHHCYRERPKEESDEGDLKGDDRKEAEKNREAARVWISGLEAVQRRLGLSRIIDLSATPFFLRGSGYAEGTLFPWTMSDFSLMDAIECGIVKLPRVPVADNIAGADMPRFRNLWEHIGKRDAQEGTGEGRQPRPLRAFPRRAADGPRSALRPLHQDLRAMAARQGSKCLPASSSSATTRRPRSWSTTTSPGSIAQNEDGSTVPVPGRLELFRNFDDYGNPLAQPHTLLIDSEQLDSGEALGSGLPGNAASDEIERFRQGDHRAHRRPPPSRTASRIRICCARS